MKWILEEGENIDESYKAPNELVVYVTGGNPRYLVYVDSLPVMRVGDTIKNIKITLSKPTYDKLQIVLIQSDGNNLQISPD